MSFSKISALTGFAALVSQVSAHGLVTGIVADGIYYQGYDTNFQYMTSPPDVVGWSIPQDQGRGPITPDQYASSDIICHLGATNAKASAPVAAGGKVELQWTAWPESHHGPVIDYLADCGGDCTTVDKTTLKWFKIDAGGLVDDSVVPGTWASDQLIANNNSWTVTIPSDLASGNYVLRHEIIALHSAGEANGAQNYPQCVNLQITGTGTATPSTSGTLGTALYTATDAGILVNIYTTLASYLIPGPALYSGAATESQSAVPAATSVASSAAVIASSAAVVESSAAVETTAVAEVASTSSVAAAVTTQVPVATAAPFSNSTIATSSKKSKSACKAKTSATAVPASTKKTKSACKAKSTSASGAAVSLTVSALNVNAAVPTASVSAEIQTTSAASVTIATSAPTSTAESTISSVTEPEGTTLNDLLSWLSSFFSSHEGKSYDANTVARRHARDIVQRDMDKFSEKKVHATGTATRSSGAHPTHHHYRPSGTGHANGKGHAKPTGSFVLGSPMPTGARHFQAAGY